jgi:phage terminase large subunit-like protein
MKARRRSRIPAPWWGDGPSPTERWLGVTIDFRAEYSTLRRRWETHDGKYFYDGDRAHRVCQFFPTFLLHHIGEFAGQRFHLLDYQRLLMVAPLWGWRRSDDGRRRFTKTFWFLPKGNGKSPLGAGIGIYATRCDNEAAAEVYCVAADRAQGRIVHDSAKIMVENSDALSDGAEIYKDAIVWGTNVYKVLSADAATKHGFRPYVVIFDEIHAQRNRDLFEALTRSMVKRREPLMIIMTHAGSDDEGIGYEEYEYAKAVLTGINPDEACLPVIFEAAPSEDWTLPATMQRVNPGYGVTVQPDGLARSVREAIAEPRKLNDLLMFHLNRWVNQAVAWIPVDWWDRCDAPMPSDEELRKYPCASGIDMAQKIDLASAVVGFRLPLAPDDPALSVEIIEAPADESGEASTRLITLDFRLVLVPAFWLPEEMLGERVRNDHVRYDIWKAQNLLRVVPGAVVGAEPIVTYLVGRDGRSGLLTRFPRLKQGEHAYDPAFATEVALGLQARHIPEERVIEVRQNYQQLSEACQVFEALVKARRVIHGGHALLRWNLENVAVKRDDAGRIRPVKPKNAAKRIDGVVASILATSRLMLLPPEGPKKARRARVWTPAGFVDAVPPAGQPGGDGEQPRA